MDWRLGQEIKVDVFEKTAIGDQRYQEIPDLQSQLWRHSSSLTPGFKVCSENMVDI